MKNTRLLFLLSFLSISSYSQIQFENGLSYKDALEKAQKSNKNLFIYLESPKCDQCNEVATKGFESPMVREKYSTNFICLRFSPTSSDWKFLSEKYNTNESMLSIFLDANENTLFRTNNTTTHYIPLLENAEKAIENTKKVQEIKTLEEKYKSGERSAEVLEKLITARNASFQEYQGLLEEYVSQLTVATLSSEKTIRFILENTPTIDGRVRKILNAVNDSKKVDSIFVATIDQAKRSELNRKTVNEAFNRAVRTRNINLARQAAGFSSNTYRPDYRRGSLVYSRMIVDFYKQTRDTLQFLQESKNHYLNLQPYLNVDSLLKEDVKRMDELRRKGTGSSFIFSPTSQYYLNELNNLARGFYEMAKYNADLEKALEWAKKTIDIDTSLKPNKKEQSSSYANTYALLLYKVNRKEQAIEWQTKAIELQKLKDVPTQILEETLVKMKSGKL